MSLLTKNLVIMSLSQNKQCSLILNNMYKHLGPLTIFNQNRNYAARKGTREKRRKQKVKVEEVKVGFIPHNQRDKEKFLLTRPKRKFDDSWKKLPTDDVYPQKFYRWRIYDFVEAVQCHRETHHPEMYNQPTANLHLTIELNMAGEKKNRFLDNFSKIVPIPHKFDHGEERTILAFSKDRQMVEEVTQAGAQLAGGTELVQEFQNGNFSIHDFQFVLAHPNILPELVVLRGLMKKKFPNVKNGTLEVDLTEAVKTMKTGIHYSGMKDEFEQDFGSIETVIGTLDMEPKHLEENFAALINSVYTFQPKRAGSFITRCLLWSPPSPEKLKIDHNVYLKKGEGKTKENETDIVEEKQLQNKIAA